MQCTSLIILNNRRRYYKNHCLHNFAIIYRPKKRTGICKIPTPCFNGMINWPRDGKCYTLHTRGPCARGKLLAIGNDKIAECLVRFLIFLFFSVFFFFNKYKNY